MALPQNRTSGARSTNAGVTSNGRYRVVLAAAVIQSVIIGCMFAYGVYFTYLEQELGWSRTLLSGSMSLAFLVMGLLAVYGGSLSDRYGPRWVLSVTGLTTGIGYMLMSQMNAPWQLLLIFGGFIGIGLSTHDVATLSTVAAWFDKRRGVMTGVVKCGTAVGQIVMPVFVTFLITSYGWRSSLWMLGIAVGIVLLLAAQWMRKPDGSNSSVPAQLDAPMGLSYADARKTRTLWTLCAIAFCFLPALMTIPLHIVAHATDLGMTTVKAATVLSTIGGASIIGRLAFGLLLDKIGGKLVLLVCLLPLAVSLASLIFITNPTSLFLFGLIYGIAHGGLFTVVSPIIANYFGMRAHGAIFGQVMLFGTLGGAAGPLLAGYIFDQLGSYHIVFLVLIGLAVAGFLLAVSLPKSAIR